MMKVNLTHTDIRIRVNYEHTPATGRREDEGMTTEELKMELHRLLPYHVIEKGCMFDAIDQLTAQLAAAVQRAEAAEKETERLKAELRKTEVNCLAEFTRLRKLVIKYGNRCDLTGKEMLELDEIEGKN